MTFKKIAIFLFVNMLGFSAVTVCFLIGVQAGLFDALDDNTALALRNTLFINTTATWLVCFFFSFAYFFFRSAWRHLFLWASVFVPFFYGLSLLFA